jgi:hypothetical protein
MGSSCLLEACPGPADQRSHIQELGQDTEGRADGDCQRARPGGAAPLGQRELLIAYAIILPLNPGHVLNVHRAELRMELAR